MKVLMACPHCESGEQHSFLVELAPKNDCVYQVQCPQGHSFSANILYHQFQKLFEVALSALVDGYYRESIGSFAASYERFMELFVRVVMSAHKIDRDSINAAWKSISRQSERQLGAFIFLYTFEFQKPPTRIPETLVNLRNRVVHQGYFPDRSECRSYGEAVLEFIRASLDAIFDSEELWQELTRSINDQGDFSEKGPRVTYYACPLIGTNRPPSHDRKSFEEMLSYVEQVRSL